jgi:hypothetical protein
MWPSASGAGGLWPERLDRGARKFGTESERHRQPGRPEVDIFKRFASVCPLEIVAESIEKRQPPEPDLRCKTRRGEALAFELVEIIDQDLARKIANQWELGRELRDAYEALPERNAAEIRAVLDNAAVMVALAEEHLDSSSPSGDWHHLGGSQESAPDL